MKFEGSTNFRMLEEEENNPISSTMEIRLLIKYYSERTQRSGDGAVILVSFPPPIAVYRVAHPHGRAQTEESPRVGT